MPRNPDNAFAKDPRSSRELVELILGAEDREVVWEELAILHFRGSQAEFDLAQDLAKNPDPKRRELGADILGQLGWDDRTFLEESVDILLELLRDSDPHVVESVACSLGQRNHPKAIPYLLPLIGHPLAFVRLAAVHGLSMHNDLDAIRALIVLSTDSDRDVRDWATFGLASMTALDMPEIREALMTRTGEEDAEIRGEALIGLARRHDSRVLELLRLELQRPFLGNWVLEAAEELADPSLAPLLQSALASLDADVPGRFKDDFRDAIAACSGKGKSACNH